jgi:hypothetical protein
MIDLSGQVHAHASRFRLPDDKKVKRTLATYGPNGSASSTSAALQRSLESKLKARLPTGGLTMFIKGWKRKATPSGRLYCQLVASARPIGETDYGLRPTSQARDYRTGESKRWFDPARSKNLNDAAAMALWATPKALDHKDTGNLENSQFRKDGKERNDTLGRQAYGSTAQTERKGSLNPQFAFWLMGIPQGFVSSMQRAMASFRK